MRKFTLIFFSVLILLSMTAVHSLAAGPVLEITDDFENGVNTSVWRNDSKGLLIKNAPNEIDSANNAAFVDKNNRLRNYMCAMKVKNEAILEFDLMIDPDSTNTGADEFLNLYGKDSSNAQIVTTRLLSYSPSKNIVYVYGKANAFYTLAKGEWCHILVDIDIDNAVYSVYVNGNLIVNSNGATEFTWNYSSDSKGVFGPGSTLTEAEFVCRATGASMYIDNVTYAQRLYADPESEFGFYDANNNKITALDSLDTVYKATIENHGVTDENLIFYLAGYDATEITLEELAVREYTVKAGSSLKIEEHLKYLGNKVSSMKYKAFYVKNDEKLTPYSAETYISRTEASCDSTYINDNEPYKHVFVVGVDGMGTFSRNHETANGYVESMFADGNVTYDMRVATPTVSSHSWASCLTGVTPDIHGLNSNTLVENTERDVDSAYPTILSIVNDKIPDADVASIAVWGGINTGIVETEEGIYKFKGKDAAVCEEVLRYIDEDLSADRTSLTFVHLNSPDAYGHSKGYGSDATVNASYLNEVRYALWLTNKMHTALENKGILDDTLFIVTSDHGGTTAYKADGTVYGEHGGLTDGEKYAIFAIKGKNVVTDRPIENMEIRDTAAIVLYALGIEVPSYMSARIPANVFEGVPATERSVYYDPENPRYHIPVNTPSQTSPAYITNYITDNELVTYLPFDGNTNALKGGNGTAHNSVEYVPGYFGEGACLNEGYISLDNYTPGNDSFTISMWVKSAMAYKDSPLIANKVCSDTDEGFVFSFNRSSDNNWGSQFNFADGTNKMSFAPELPSDYDRGWMHVLMIVDRTENTVSISYDFAQPTKTSIPANLISASMNGENSKLYIGEDATGHHTFKMGLSVDELMIFDGAFDNGDINSLKNYYNR